MLDKVKYQPEQDCLIFTGDLVDRGPYSKETIQFIRELSSQYNVIAVLGNHDEKYIRFKKWLNWIETGKKQEIKMFFPDHKRAIYEQLSNDDLQWMEQMPTYYAAKDLLVVHAGVCPRYHLKREDLTHKKKHPERVYKIRWLDKDNVVADEDSPNADHFWAETYDGRLGTVVFGHAADREVREYGHAFGIDTGCCFGGKLTAMIYEGPQSICFESVPAHQAYHPKWEVED